jgi:MFS transporter, OPA family, sugar phosphate sensor protein UhpC
MYGFSRLLTGIVADRVSPARALGSGLLLAGLVNCAMGLPLNSPAILATLWGLNGMVQGVGAGASAKLLTSWHSRSERGAAWSLWSSSANVGAFLAPILCGWLATTGFGFRAGIFVPGAIAVTYALLVTPLIRDSPAAAGVRAPWASEDEAAAAAAAKAGADAAGQVPTPALTFRQALVDGVLKNKRMWALAASYFFVYFTRQGMRSWLHFFLVEARGVDAATAAFRVSGMEVGGIVGTFAAGYLSDAVGGRRVAVTIGFLVGLAASLVAAAMLPATSASLVDIAVFSLIGLFLNGPQCLIGLIGAEVCDIRVVATVSGVLGWVSYGGATVSGLPLSLVVRRFGWPSYWAAMILSTLFAGLLLLPMIGLKGRVPVRKVGSSRTTCS